MIDEDDAQTRPERPPLILGLLGFSPEQEREVASVLQHAQDDARSWRLGPPGDADAWWANGARVQLLADGSVRIGPGAAGRRSVRLSLQDVDRPIAFSEPLVCSDFEPAYRFRMGDPVNMMQTLATVERQWLAIRSARLWIAARLVSGERELASRIYHIVGRGRLLAVVDRAGEVGIHPGVGARDFERATWVARPDSARFVPQAFARAPLSDLLWEYALRSDSQLLPPRYRSHPIYFRRPPKVPQRMLRDEHLVVMGELACGPAAYADLRQRTGLAAASLSRALAALYLTGAISCNPRRARRWMAVSAGADSQGFRPSGLAPDSRAWTPAAARPRALREFTVPARLGGA